MYQVYHQRIMHGLPTCLCLCGLLLCSVNHAARVLHQGWTVGLPYRACEHPVNPDPLIEARVSGDSGC